MEADFRGLFYRFSRLAYQTKKLLLALVGACSLFFFCSGAWAWQTNISGGLFNATAVDGAGNVVAAGTIFNTGTGRDFAVVKFDGTSGAELWRKMINGANPGDDDARAVAVDGAGNVVAVGMLRPLSFTTIPEAWAVIKFDGVTGAELWRRVTDVADGTVAAEAVAVDAVGNVVVAGSTTPSCCQVFTVIKYDGLTGVELWRRQVSAASGSPVGEGRAVTVDGDGNVVAAGSTAADFTVIKLAGATGVELWRQAIPSGRANAVAVDGDGNVAAVGTIRIATQGGRIISSWAVIKFEGASGAELWRKLTDDSDQAVHVQANAVAVDQAGDVVVTGFINPGGHQLFTVNKYEGATGVVLWRQQVSAPSGNPVGEGKAVTVDGAGNVVAAGVTRTFSDFTVGKLDGASGARLWVQAISGGSANAVAVNGAGNVIAAGVISNTATVVKLNGTDGSDFSPPPPPSSSSRVEENDPAVSYTGTWYSNAHSVHSGGSAALSMEAGARATVTFIGTGVSWIGYRDEWSGIARIYIDGVFVSEVDTYLGAGGPQAVLYSTSGLSNTTHTLTIEVTGTKNPAASGLWIWVDAFDISTDSSPPPPPPPAPSGGRVEESDQAVDYTGSWYSNAHSVHSGGGAALSMEAGAQATMTFTGSGVSWIGYQDQWSGIARVFIDGALVAEVDTYGDPGGAQAVLYSTSGLSNAAHTLTIEVTGTKNPAASGLWIWVDAFDIAP